MLGETLTQEEFENLCFEFGIELDDVTTDALIKAKESGLSEKDLEPDLLDSETLYRVEVPANRYDLLCIEGIARALKIFRGHSALPKYTTSGPRHRIYVQPEVLAVRPVLVAAVLRNVKFTEHNYQSFIDLQDKLHLNICRRRSLASVGTHDLDTVSGPFSYEARRPEDLEFAPLNQTRVMNGHEVMSHFDGDTHLRKFLPLIRDKPRYPVIYDARGRVLSLPPIINSDHSKITLNTRNVFIEVTAMDHTKAEIVLNTIVCMFGQYCQDQPFDTERVEVVNCATGRVVEYPRLESRSMRVSVDYVNQCVGTKLGGSEMASMLTRMSLTSSVEKEEEEEGDSAQHLQVSVPPTRSDVLHPCDVMEDVAIAFGYDNLVPTVPAARAAARQQPRNQLADKLRVELANAGYTEALTFSLCARDENFKFMRLADNGSAPTLANPATPEHQIGRTSLLPGLLKTLFSNKSNEKPVKLFEVSEVMLVDPAVETGVRNERRVAAVYNGAHTSGFEHIHGLLERVFEFLDIAPRNAALAKPSPSHSQMTYSVRPRDPERQDDGPFFPGRAADLLLHPSASAAAGGASDAGVVVGTFGVFHPSVITSFSIDSPASGFEMNLDRLKDAVLPEETYKY